MVSTDREWLHGADCRPSAIPKRTATSRRKRPLTRNPVSVYRMQAPRQRDVQAIGQEGNEDVGLDARLALVKDRPDREIAPCFRRGRLLRFLNASSTATSSR